MIINFLIAAAMIFVYMNYMFVSGAILAGRAGFTIKNIREVLIAVILVIFIRNVSVIGVVLCLFLVVVYFSISKYLLARMPKKVLIRYTHEIGYYISLYVEYFLWPSFVLFLALFPAILLLSLFLVK